MKRPGFLLAVIMITCFIISCSKKNDIQNETLSLTVNLPGSEMHNELYYSVNYRERSIEMNFSQPVDSSTIKGNISFSDKDGSLDSVCSLISSGRKVILAFHTDFQMHDGWRYLLNISTGLRSTSGLSPGSATAIEIRTTAKHLLLDTDTTTRNSIVCISDIHMGDSRSVSSGYCWFVKNAPALETLLDSVLKSPQVKQLVILGDLFDGWVIPYSLPPFDSGAGIHNSRDYFLSIANSPANTNIINKLKAIAASGTIRLIYVPGNHDMLLTKEILQEIIPGVNWQGDPAGLGYYSPLSEIIMEHGHRYDFFNCPQPNAVPGHILPPGYFISRLDAEGLMKRGGNRFKEMQSGAGGAEFLTAWTAAFTYLEVKYALQVAADSANIRMDGIDSYPGPLSFNGVRDMYAANIENEWPSTQTINAVAVTMPVLMAILDGSIDLSLTATYEYMQPLVPKLRKIVVFGHTHNPMIKVYPAGNQYAGIYANTGSWVNAELSSKPVRTFVVIKPGEWTGSDLDVVSLFQYNLDSGSGDPNPGFIPVLLSEESIQR
jgi:UDP-2,3-diacylglucosamine pyrophosphatase LpxH